MNFIKMNLRGKILVFGLCLFGWFSVFASNSIKVIVTTDDKKTWALGYVVKGKKKGGVGQKYSGKGPANSLYEFGYRKKTSKKKNISCGSHRLSRNSHVTLITKGETCKAQVKYID